MKSCSRALNGTKERCSEIGRALFRRKRADTSGSAAGQAVLERKLSIFDLVGTGVGVTLGIGIYVLTGQLAATMAGPAVTISFLIAGAATVLAGLCYAELGSLITTAGAIYHFAYAAIGEFLSFILAWTILLEYGIGVAISARSFTKFVDFFAKGKFQATFLKHLPIGTSYWDPLAMALVLVATALLSTGIKVSSRVNGLLVTVNIFITVVIIIACALLADPGNLNIPFDQVDRYCDRKNETDCGSGGFMPFGFTGVLSAASAAFYAFNGFDAICFLGAEVKRPHKAIPISIIITLVFVSFAYILTCIMIGMATPYYELSDEIPLATLFAKRGQMWAQYSLSIGAIVSLATTIIMTLMPLPRILFSLAGDGLLCSCFGYVDARTGSPLFSTILSGILASLIASIVDLEGLIEMFSIGTLLAFTIATASVIILRYEHDSSNVPAEEAVGDIRVIMRGVVTSADPEPSERSQRIVKILLSIVILPVVATAVTLTYAFGRLPLAGALTLTMLFLLSICLIGFAIWRQPQRLVEGVFKIPLMPFTPLLSMTINIYLMLQLSILTLYRFLIWSIIGLGIYFGYSVWHSAERRRQDSNNGLLMNEEVSSVANCNSHTSYGSI